LLQPSVRSLCTRRSCSGYRRRYVLFADFQFVRLIECFWRLAESQNSVKYLESPSPFPPLKFCFHFLTLCHHLSIWRDLHNTLLEGEIKYLGSLQRLENL
ncbi:hypothetical protein LINPERPRIM_LOCUS37594, partial [Linum perenne]